MTSKLLEKLLLLSTICLCLRMCLYLERVICIKVHAETLLMLSTVYLPCKAISVIGVCICKKFDSITLNCIVMFCSFLNTRILLCTAVHLQRVSNLMDTWEVLDTGF